jgi:photosystem II reaction center protein Psb28
MKSIARYPFNSFERWKHWNSNISIYESNILDKNTKEGEITGMYLVDEEGTLETRDVNARFVNGRPEAIESIYMKSPEAWDRFMRFMEDMETNGLAPKLIKN